MKEIKCLAIYEALATKMTRGEYNKLRGWIVPLDENPDDGGFMMQRLDQPANVDGLNGYISWVPEKVFNDTYFITTSYFDRLIIECEQFEDKLLKLKEFINSEKFGELSGNVQELMKKQVGIMENYIDCLRERMDMIEYESQQEYLYQQDVSNGYE